MSDQERILREALTEIAGLAGTCITQRAPSDDKIIAEHIVEIKALASFALKATKGGA